MSPLRSMPDSEQLVRIRELFDLALELPASDRQGFLDTACDRGEIPRPLLDRLLEAHAGTQEPVPVARIDIDMGGMESGTAEEPPTACVARGLLAVGDEFAGCRIDRVMSLTGTAEVYEARQLVPARRVAMKLLRSVRGNEEAWRRMRVEVEALARLEHPGIVPVHAFGVAREGAAAEHPYLLMAFVEGEHIDAWARRERPEPAQVALLIAEAAEAVHHANLRGVVHRDLKPSNLMVRPDGRIAVIDFGVAKLCEGLPDARASLDSLATSVVGTPAYMAPEQFTPSESGVDLRVDVYALGVVAFELIAGRPPLAVSGLSLGRMAMLKEDRVPEPLRQLLGRGVSRELSNAIAVALAISPADRYESCAALAEDLRRAATSRAILRRPPGPARRAVLFARRNPLLMFLGVAVLLASVAGVVGVAWQAAMTREQRDIAQARFDDTRSLARFIIFDLTRQLEARPNSLQLRRSLVAEATEYLDRLSRDLPADARRWSASDRELALELARSHIRLGDILGNVMEPNLGDKDAALPQIEAGLSLARRLLVASPDDPKALWVLGAGMRSHIYAKEYATPDDPGALDDLHEALSVFQRALASSPADPEIRVDVARTSILAGLYRWRVEGRVDQAIVEVGRGVDALQALADQGAAGAAIQLAHGLRYLADMQFRRDGVQADPAPFLHAAAAFRQLLAEQPGHPLLESDLAVCLARASTLLADGEAASEAMPMARGALAIAERLNRQEPEDRLHAVRLMTLRSVFADTCAEAARASADPAARVALLHEAIAALGHCIQDLEGFIQRGWDRGTLFRGYIAEAEAKRREYEALLGETPDNPLQ